MTIRSGFMTSRIVHRVRSRRIPFIAIRFCDRRSMSLNTARPGSEMSSSERAIGRAADRICRSNGNTLSIHQRATSGNESRRSVSPVGGQSTPIASPAPRQLAHPLLNTRPVAFHLVLGLDLLSPQAIAGLDRLGAERFAERF